jgi:hypothetical protein
MRDIAASVMLEYLGYDVKLPALSDVKGDELCASLAWACALSVVTAGHGCETVSRFANDRNRSAVALITALIDGEDDVIQAAVDALDGCDVVGVCFELFGVARLIAGDVSEQRDAVRCALQAAL